MARRKRVRNFHQLNDLMIEHGCLPTGQGLNKGPIRNDTEFQDDHLVSISPEMAQPLGRVPGRGLSIDDENLLYSVTTAFDEGVLNKLSQRQRECFTDVIISGDTYEAVARRYSITKSAVQIYVKRAAVRIRKDVEARDGI